MQILWYLLPVGPLASRSILAFRFRKQIRDVLPDSAVEASEHRGFIFSLAGFSFTALLALVVLETHLAENFELAIFYLFISFIAFMWALNLQSYTSRRWHSQLGFGLIEVGTLSLLLSVVAVLGSGTLRPVFVNVLSLLALSIWLLDHSIRLRLDFRYLQARERKQREKGGANGSEEGRQEEEGHQEEVV